MEFNYIDLHYVKRKIEFTAYFFVCSFRLDESSMMSNLLQGHSVSMESLTHETASNTGSHSSGKKAGGSRRGRKSDKVRPIAELRSSMCDLFT